MNDGVYFGENGNEVIVINGFGFPCGYVWRLQYVIKRTSNIRLWQIK